MCFVNFFFIRIIRSAFEGLDIEFGKVPSNIYIEGFNRFI